MERLEKHLQLLLASSLSREFPFCSIPDVALASDVTLASDVALASDAALASAPVVKLSWISFHLHVCQQLGCALLMLGFLISCILLA